MQPSHRNIVRYEVRRPKRRDGQRHMRERPLLRVEPDTRLDRTKTAEDRFRYPRHTGERFHSALSLPALIPRNNHATVNPLAAA